MDNKLAVMEKYKDQINANNAALNRTNMLLIEKMTKTDEQMDEVAAHARIIRLRTDAFLGKIENRDFAFLPLAREFVEER